MNGDTFSCREDLTKYPSSRPLRKSRAMCRRPMFTAAVVVWGISTGRSSNSEALGVTDRLRGPVIRKRSTQTGLCEVVTLYIGGRQTNVNMQPIPQVPASCIKCGLRHIYLPVGHGQTIPFAILRKDVPHTPIRHVGKTSSPRQVVIPISRSTQRCPLRGGV